MHLSCRHISSSHDQPQSSSSSAMADEPTTSDINQEEKSTVVTGLDTDTDEEESFTLGIDYDDNLSVASDNSHFSRTEVLTEPKEYNSGYFGSIPTDTASNISGMLYNVAQQYNIPREAYATIIDIINDKVIPAAGNPPTLFSRFSRCTSTSSKQRWSTRCNSPDTAAAQMVVDSSTILVTVLTCARPPAWPPNYRTCPLRLSVISLRQSCITQRQDSN
ncbi:hypothetical protein [Absidia glauca]|uniref:Uncharacterized protein n=1 Tax=Absidia glauca TaxID=4829 RepID=A0A168T947_ABSGL|nr:hypothetical protein [Absidia glauca]